MRIPTAALLQVVEVVFFFTLSTMISVICSFQLFVRDYSLVLQNNFLGFRNGSVCLLSCWLYIHSDCFASFLLFCDNSVNFSFKASVCVEEWNVNNPFIIIGGMKREAGDIEAPSP